MPIIAAGLASEILVGLSSQAFNLGLRLCEGSLNGYARCAKVALERMKMTIQINLLCIIFSGRRKRRSKKD